MTLDPADAFLARPDIAAQLAPRWPWPAADDAAVTDWLLARHAALLGVAAPPAWPTAALASGWPSGYVARQVHADALFAEAGLLDAGEVGAEAEFVMAVNGFADPARAPRRHALVALRLDLRRMASRTHWSERRRRAERAARDAVGPLLMRGAVSAEIQAAADAAGLGALLPDETRHLVDREIWFALRAARRARRHGA